jgi:hypothetical protein
MMKEANAAAKAYVRYLERIRDELRACKVDEFRQKLGSARICGALCAETLKDLLVQGTAVVHTLGDQLKKGISEDEKLEHILPSVKHVTRLRKEVTSFDLRLIAYVITESSTALTRIFDADKGLTAQKEAQSLLELLIETLVDNPITSGFKSLLDGLLARENMVKDANEYATMLDARVSATWCWCITVRMFRQLIVSLVDKSADYSLGAAVAYMGGRREEIASQP